MLTSGTSARASTQRDTPPEDAPARRAARPPIQGTSDAANAVNTCAA
jgi:hypothetical protein